jgi:hypothetical protein
VTAGAICYFGWCVLGEGLVAFVTGGTSLLELGSACVGGTIVGAMTGVCDELMAATPDQESTPQEELTEEL